MLMTEAINGLHSEQRDTKVNFARGKSKNLRRKLRSLTSIYRAINLLLLQRNFISELNWFTKQCLNSRDKVKLLNRSSYSKFLS
jgi:hypothetical protein